MNIAFDASDICTGRADGTTRYTRELIKRLPELDKEDYWNFYGPCAAPSHPLHLPLGQGERITWHATPFPGAWTQTRFAWELLKDNPDILFMPIQQLPIFRRPRMKTVAVIHDLAFHEYGEQFRMKDWLLLQTFSAQVAHEADAIIAVSEATKQDIKKYYGREENVHVVHHGIDHDKFRIFSDEQKEAGLKKLKEKYSEIQKPYLLFVGQIQPRKNIARLIEAFELLQNSELQLVIAGGHGWNNKEIYARIEHSSSHRKIVVPGAVPDELLPTLYANATAFIFPSLQEGFGIPLIEAAACGVPVITSNCSSMKEIMKDAGVLVDPLSSHAIGDGIAYALKNKTEIAQACAERSQQFSWDKTAAATLRVIREVSNV
ncbi:MAG TPA: glycosyltransferase family 1 protein [Candidatus Andersenbacteria bacterium]|nr:glycosyltransferase family 1 protein [Candidatus Andersenbacteria bacterium]